MNPARLPCQTPAKTKQQGMVVENKMMLQKDGISRKPRSKPGKRAGFSSVSLTKMGEKPRALRFWPLALDMPLEKLMHKHPHAPTDVRLRITRNILMHDLSLQNLNLPTVDLLTQKPCCAWTKNILPLGACLTPVPKGLCPSTVSAGFR